MVEVPCELVIEQALRGKTGEIPTRQPSNEMESRIE